MYEPTRDIGTGASAPRVFMRVSRKNDPAVLFGYFDESGEHDRTSGNLLRLTIGGAIASVESWEAFSIEWAALLESYSITMFHMTDFEANKGEFTGWEKTKHVSFIEHCLTIMARHLRTPLGFCLGFTNSAPKRKALTVSYESDLVDAILFGANREAYGLREPLSLVFAKHPEFQFTRIKDVFQKISKVYPRVHDISVNDPRISCPLQAADLIAYEVRSLQRENGSPTNRYPLRRLRQLGCVFRFSQGC